jgi:phosphate transport system substrate-binding protein
LSRAGRSRLLAEVFLLTLVLVLAACGGGGQDQEGRKNKEEKSSGVSGRIVIEGSGTVRPITQGVAEGFGRENPDVQIQVGETGTGEGFEALCTGAAQISNASRPINEEEAEICEQNGIEFVELPVAWDGISVVVSPQNDFASDVTGEELRRLWEPAAEGRITSWNQVRPSWPTEEIALYGPGAESGTFEYFTGEIVGEQGESRADYQAIEDGNVLAQEVSGDPDALGYLGYSFFAENQGALRALPINGVAPSQETIASGQYPLSRPLFIYVSRQALEENLAVEEFVNFYLDEANVDRFVEDATYVPLSDTVAAEARRQLEDRTVGTVFQDGELPEGQTLEEALRESI